MQVGNAEDQCHLLPAPFAVPRQCLSSTPVCPLTSAGHHLSLSLHTSQEHRRASTALSLPLLQCPGSASPPPPSAHSPLLATTSPSPCTQVGNTGGLALPSPCPFCSAWALPLLLSHLPTCGQRCRRAFPLPVLPHRDKLFFVFFLLFLLYFELCRIRCQPMCMLASHSDPHQPPTSHDATAAMTSPQCTTPPHAGTTASPPHLLGCPSPIHNLFSVPSLFTPPSVTSPSLPCSLHLPMTSQCQAHVLPCASQSTSNAPSSPPPLPPCTCQGHKMQSCQAVGEGCKREGVCRDGAIGWVEEHGLRSGQQRTV